MNPADEKTGRAKPGGIFRGGVSSAPLRRVRSVITLSVRAVVSSADGPKRGRGRAAPAADTSPSRREAARREQARRDNPKRPSAREQVHSEPRRRKNRLDEVQRHFSRRGEQCTVAEGARRDSAVRAVVTDRSDPTSGPQRGYVTFPLLHNLSGSGAPGRSENGRMNEF